MSASLAATRVPSACADENGYFWAYSLKPNAISVEGVQPGIVRVLSGNIIGDLQLGGADMQIDKVPGLFSGLRAICAHTAARGAEKMLLLVHDAGAEQILQLLYGTGQISPISTGDAKVLVAAFAVFGMCAMRPDKEGEQVSPITDASDSFACSANAWAKIEAERTRSIPLSLFVADNVHKGRPTTTFYLKEVPAAFLAKDAQRDLNRRQYLDQLYSNLARSTEAYICPEHSASKHEESHSRRSRSAAAKAEEEKEWQKSKGRRKNQWVEEWTREEEGRKDVGKTRIEEELATFQEEDRRREVQQTRKSGPYAQVREQRVQATVKHEVEEEKTTQFMRFKTFLSIQQEAVEEAAAFAKVLGKTTTSVSNFAAQESITSAACTTSVSAFHWPQTERH